MDRVIGKVCFYKDEKFYIKDLKMSDDEIKSLFRENKSNHTVSPYTKEETNRILENKDLEKVYKRSIEQGFSVIRYIKNIEFSDGKILLNNQYSLQGVISDKIDKKTAKMFKRDLATITSKFDITDGYFKIKQVDYYDYIDNDILNKLDYFLKEKTDSLSNKEKVMFDKYRNFDLETLLTDDSLQKNPINNSNGGVMVISQNDSFNSTCKGFQHGYDIKNYYERKFKTNVDEKSIYDLVKDFNDIIIQVALNELIIWLPEKINEYQMAGLKNLLEQVFEYREKFQIVGAIENDLNNELTSIEDFYEYIDNQKNLQL